MKLFITGIFLLTGFTAFSQKADNRITIGTIDTVYSKILGEKRIIYIHIPNGDKSKHYPVLYILDGESHFQSAVAITEQISGIIPEMIVVGIPNTNRIRDFSPTHINPDKLVNAGTAKQTGGGENFMSFFEKELIPYIDTHYPTTSYRIISGHSLGGLAVMNAFFNHTNLFNAFIAVDPSIWWDGERWINKYKSELASHNFNNKSLFVAIANNIPPGMDTLSIVTDTTDKAPITHAVLPFVHFIQSNLPKDLLFGTKFYPNEWHGSVELNAEYDALRYIFKFYHFDMNNFRAHPKINADSLLSAHFDNVSARMGYKVVAGEDMVNNMAYASMEIHEMKVAAALFLRNVRDYTQSSNAWDSLGEFYEANGEKQKAIAAYTKSLGLKETEDTRRKLNSLTGK
jgi:uncharacterized protein